MPLKQQLKLPEEGSLAASTIPSGDAVPSSLLKKVFEVSRWATLIQDPSARRTKDSQPSGFGFEYCASHVRFRVFQQTARGDRRVSGRESCETGSRYRATIRDAQRQ